MSFAIKAADTAAQESRETAAQTAQEARSGDTQAVKKLAAEQKSTPSAAEPSTLGPATVVAISAQAKALSTSGDADHDGDSH